MSFQLRPYQTRALELIRESWRDEKPRVCLVAPTGAGKTVIAAEMIRRVADNGKRVVFLAHRKELIAQTLDKLDECGVDPSPIVAGGKDLKTDRRWYWHHRHNPVQVASKDTLHSWLRRGNLPDAPDLVIVDECHRAVARTYADIMEAWASARVIGLTATPYRSDGKGLGREFDAIQVVAQIHELIESGALVKPRIFVGPPIDLSAVHVRGGDYVESELGEAMNTPTLIGNATEAWLEHAQDRPTIIFATTIAHSLAFAERFAELGVSVRHVDGSFKAEARDSAVRDFREGRIQVLTNCQLFTEGFDATACSAVLLARPTKSTGLYLQMAGRALRPHPGKSDCVVVDLAGAYYEHGHVAEPRTFSLADDLDADKGEGGARKEDDGFNLESFEVMDFAGAALPREVEAKLEEVRDSSGDPMLDFYLRERDKALMRGKLDAMSVHIKFTQKFDRWPPAYIASRYVEWGENAAGKKRPFWRESV